MPAKKTKRQEKQKLVEIKITIGRNFEGDRIQKSFYGATKREAKRKAENFKKEQELGRLIVRDENFASWSRTWLEHYKKGKVKPSTYQFTFLNAVENHLIPYFGDRQLTSIKPVDIQGFFNEKAKTHARDSIKKMRMCLDGIFRTAIENDLCLKNPVTKDIRIPEPLVCEDEDAKEPKQVYTKEQRDVVLEFAKTHRFGLDVMVLLKTGMRRGELLGLRWEDIDSENGVIYIRRAAADIKNDDGEWDVFVGPPKTPQSVRPIPIDDDLLKALNNKPRTITIGRNLHKKIPGKVIETNYIFHDKSGKVSSPNNWSHRRYKVFMKDLHAAYPNIPILSPHELRHTAATLWKDAGVDVYSIAKLGGWADLDMIAKRYAHNNIDSLKAALGLVSNKFK